VCLVDYYHLITQADILVSNWQHEVRQGWPLANRSIAIDRSIAESKQVDRAWFCIELTKIPKKNIFQSIFLFIAFYGIFYLCLYYQPVDRELSRNFVADPNRRQVGHRWSTVLPIKTQYRNIFTAGLLLIFL